MLASESPTELEAGDIQVEMAFNAIDAGEHYRMSGQPAASKADFQIALRVLDEHADLLARSTAPRRLRAMALLNLASAMNETGHYDEAKVNAAGAVELLLPLAGAGVDHAEESLLLVLAQDNLAVAQRELGNPVESKRIFDLAIKRATALKDKFNSPDIKRVFGTVQIDLGELLAADRARQGEAQAAFEFTRGSWSRWQGLIPIFRASAATSPRPATASAERSSRLAALSSETMLRRPSSTSKALRCIARMRGNYLWNCSSRARYRTTKVTSGERWPTWRGSRWHKETATRPAPSSTRRPLPIERRSRRTRKVSLIASCSRQSCGNELISSDRARRERELRWLNPDGL